MKTSVIVLVFALFMAQEIFAANVQPSPAQKTRLHFIYYGTDSPGISQMGRKVFQVSHAVDVLQKMTLVKNNDPS